MNFRDHLIKEEQQILADFINFCEANNLPVTMESVTVYNEFLSKMGQGARRALVGATLPFLMWQTGTATAQNARGKSATPAQKPVAAMAQKAEIAGVKKMDMALKNWKAVNTYSTLVTKEKESDLSKTGMRGGKGMPYKIIFGGSKEHMYHQNAFGVKSDFDFSKIKRTQDSNPDWRYIPALNKFVSLKDLQDSDSPLEVHLHDSYDGKEQGTVGEFFGMQQHELEDLFSQGLVPIQKAPKMQTTPDSPLRGLPKVETDPSKIPDAPKQYKPNVY